MTTNEIFARIKVKRGDITKEKTAAIVNAANTSLLGGGGVDGAIHRAAGPKLLEECARLGGCAHGEARITGAYDLPCKHVIHTPGPIYIDGKHGEAKTLQSSYVNSLRLAMENNLASIAFPAISAGIYGYPKEDACRIAVTSAVEFMKETDYAIDVIFVMFDDENLRIYEKQIEELRNELS